MSRSAARFTYVLRKSSLLTIVIVERWELGFMHRIPTVITLLISGTAGQRSLLGWTVLQCKATNIIEDFLGL